MIEIKLVLNKCFGGFNLSEKAFKMWMDKKGIFDLHFMSNYKHHVDRLDLDLISTIEELGDEANSEGCKLEIITITIRPLISSVDGYESVNF